MKTTHPFLLCENPINNINFEQFIYSTIDQKKALIEINELEITDIFNAARSEYGHTFYFVSKETGAPEFYNLTVFDNIDIPEHTISVVLKEAGKWYKNYLIWEEKQQEESCNAAQPLVKNYNDKVNGLKIIHSTSADKWMIILKSKIKVFATEMEADDWLINDMNIDEDDLENGVVNEI